LRAEGHETVALSRGQARIRGASRTVQIPGLVRGRELDSAVRGVDAVVHLAARVHVLHESARNQRAQYDSANLEGTKAVLASARLAGARAFVFVSTAKVHGEGRSRPYTEHDDPAPQDAYSESKLAAEEEVAATPVDAMNWTILRPPLVYGPGVGGNFRRLLALASSSRRLPLPFGAVDNRRSLVFVGNLVDAIATSLVDSRAHGQRFLISDGQEISTADLLRRLAMSMGLRPRLWACPPAIMRFALGAVGKRSEAARLLGSFTVDSSLFEHVVGWHVQTDMETALGETVRWWLQGGGRA
jgi:UDP-glucose 4-epimerase